MMSSFRCDLFRLIGLSLLITLIIAGIGSYFMLANVKVISNQYDNAMKPAIFMEEIKANYWQAHALMLQMALDKERSQIDENHELLNALHEKNDLLIKSYKATDFYGDKEKILFDNVMEKLDAYQQVSAEAISLVLVTTSDSAIMAFNKFNHDKLLPRFHEFINAQAELTDYLLETAAVDNQQNADDSYRAFYTIIGVIVLGIMVLLLAGYYLTQKIMRVLRGVTGFAQDISVNHFDWVLDENLLERKDEFGIMYRALDRMRVKLSETMNSLNSTAEQLAASTELALKANQHKSVFLARMSHEIRTPLNAIVGMTYIAKKAKDLAVISDCLNKITTSSSHLLGVINDILDMSKIEAGKLELVEEEFGLEKLLMNVSTVVSVKTDEKQQDLLISVDNGVSSRFIGDSLRITQVLTNIINNATKFTPFRGTIKLRVSCEERGSLSSQLSFVVEDNGIGLTQEQIDRLFMPFEQADGGTSRQFGGTGLGLAICDRIVRMMGGTIKVESEFGKGSRFIIKLKLKNSQQLEPAKLDASVDVFTARTLLIDQSEEVREFFARLFSELNISITTAENVENAWNLLQSRPEDDPFNIIFLDWNTAENDGAEFVKKVKNQFGNKTIVVLVSNSRFAEIEDTATNAGVNRFLAKPVFPSMVINLLNEVVGTPEEHKLVPAKAVADFDGKSILLVEDVDINREIVKAYLEGTAVQLEIAENGVEAVEKYAKSEGRYDAVLMDVHMPLMDGYAATQRIRLDEKEHQWPRVPIIAMTANAFKEDIDQCLEAGMDAHVAKPIDAEDLLLKLKRALNGGLPQIKEA